jgi:SAM-dependent methyltransferase
MTVQQDDWDKHWKEYADAAAENPAQEYRRRLVFAALGIQGDGAGARILDIGSGQGDFAVDVAERLPKARVLGLELSHTGVAVASRKVPSARFCQCDLLQPVVIPDDLKGWATHAVCSEVLEHLDQPVTLLRNVQGYLAPGCRLVVTVPGGPMSAFDKHIGHRRHYAPGMLRDLLRDAGFQPERTSGAGFPFFNVYRSAVILRGDRVVQDVAAKPNGELSPLALFAMRMFGVLFHLNISASPWGWQTVAVASNDVERL